MKKSKIILPALGMLLLSTAASVTGTVAWFTTVSTASANLTSFAIRKLGGELGLTIKTATDGSQYGTGTTKSGESIILNGDDPALCDASYDHVTQQKIYKANSAATAFSTLAAESNWVVNGDDQVTYYAVSWTLEFTYTFGGDSSNVNLYFDLDAANLTGTQVTAGTVANKETWKGFRIAFICGARTLVWAGGHASSEAASLVFQSGATRSTTTAYTNPNSSSAAGTLITGFGTSGTCAAALHAPTDDLASAARADYIGAFVKGATDSTTLSVKCIAWYEGNDENVVNGARMDQVAATMAFYTRVNQA